jgi:hypothetical protein
MELQASFGLSRLLTEGKSPAVLDTLKRALDQAEGIGALGPQLRLICSLHLPSPDRRLPRLARARRTRP